MLRIEQRNVAISPCGSYATAADTTAQINNTLSTILPTVFTASCKLLIPLSIEILTLALDPYRITRVFELEQAGPFIRSAIG